MLRDAGDIPDPREPQITRFKTKITKLRDRLVPSELTVEGPTDFRSQALARLAAQHEEIVRCRESAATSTPPNHVTPAP